MDSVDIVHGLSGHCPLPDGQCPCTQWTLPMDSEDIVHGPSFQYFSRTMFMDNIHWVHELSTDGSWPYLGFCPILNILLWILRTIQSEMLQNQGKYSEKCNNYIKYFCKIKCHADRPYLVFSELKPEAHTYFFLGLMCKTFFSLTAINFSHFAA